VTTGRTAALHALVLVLGCLCALAAAVAISQVPRPERYPEVKSMRPCRALIDGSPFAFCGTLSTGETVVTNKWRGS